MSVSRWIGYFLFFILLQANTQLVQAEKSLDSVENSLAIVYENIKIFKKKPNIDEALRLRILKAYYATEDNFDELIQIEQQVQKQQSQLKKLPAEIRQIKRQIIKAENIFSNKKIENFSIFPVDELEQRLVFEKANLNQITSSVSQKSIQLAELLIRPQNIREQSAEVRNELSISQQEKNLLKATVSNNQELLARQSQVNSRLQKLNAVLALLELENITSPLDEQTQTLRRQLLNLQSESVTNLVNSLDAFLTSHRLEEISKEQAELLEIQKGLSGKHVLLQKTGNENIRYSQLLLDTNTKLAKYLDLRNDVDSLYKQLEKDYQSAEQKINLAGLSPALGNLLREQRRNIPLAQTYQTQFEQIKKDIAFVSLELFQMDEVKKSLLNIEQTLQLKMSEFDENTGNETDKLKVQMELRTFLLNQKKLLVKLGFLYLDYSRTLADVDYSIQQLVTLGAKFNYYLNQRLLWVPSAPVVDQHFFLELFDSVVWLVNGIVWQQTGWDIKNSFQTYPFLDLLAITVLLTLLWFRKAIKLKLQALLKNSTSFYSDHFNYTYYGLFYVFLMVLPLPFLVFFIGWLLQINESSTAFSYSVSQGLIASSIPLLIIQFFYFLFKDKGIMQSLFSWQNYSTQLLCSQLKWLRFVVVPCIFLISMFNENAYSVQSYTLGRMALIICLLAISYVLHRITHPMKGLAKDYYQKNKTHWSTRLRYIWYGVAILSPLLIIGFALAGYYQSSLELQHKLIVILRIIFFTALFHEIIIRWMVLTIRQLAIQNIKQKHKLQKLAETKEGGDVNTRYYEDDSLLDIPKINEQSKKILNATVCVILLVGVWLTISDILPALSIFDKVILWQHTNVVDGREELQAITLINVFFCLLYFLFMSVFVNNFPGLIDLLFARRYSMEAGSRYALIQLTRYAVIAITLITITNELGGSWSQVQWLVAAVSVGLGFGLQEIFANMVSGIILLFERPIRVGDTVTVGEVTGTVCRIQMRATTIIDWDQKELIVPNKIFITDKLINWSLTDTVTRVVIAIGVSYDSDEERVITLFKQVMEESPLVLDEPEPSVYFLGFGDSSLDFNIRVFVRDLNDRLPVTDDLHRRIRRIFKEHNIEIPFPQQDLHIRSTVQSAAMSLKDL